MEESCLVLMRVEDGGRHRALRVPNGANRELEVVG
jgi:hypothetical protein